MAQSSVSAPSVSRWATRLARNGILFAPAHRQLYATLISNRDLLMLQVHALSVVDVPEIGAAFRKGLQTIAKFVKSRSGAADAAVQRFFAYGQLCHLITTISLDGNSAAWARMLTAGMRHRRYLACAHGE